MLEPSPPEPEDPIEVSCTECGEYERIKHINESIWECLICKETFSDGTDRDDCFEDHNF